MIPIISLVGYANSGKTTVLVKIISELKSRGYRVGTIKHHGGDFDIDHEGKDTYRHMKAGADTTVLSSPNKFALISKVENERTLDELVNLITDVDIIITEGYKREDKPKIEVFRAENNKPRIKGIEEDLIATISDVEITDNVSNFSFDDIEKIVDLIEKGYISENIITEK